MEFFVWWGAAATGAAAVPSRADAAAAPVSACLNVTILLTCLYLLPGPGPRPGTPHPEGRDDQAGCEPYGDDSGATGARPVVPGAGSRSVRGVTWAGGPVSAREGGVVLVLPEEADDVSRVVREAGAMDPVRVQELRGAPGVEGHRVVQVEDRLRRRPAEDLADEGEAQGLLRHPRRGRERRVLACVLAGKSGRELAGGDRLGIDEVHGLGDGVRIPGEVAYRWPDEH